MTRKDRKRYLWNYLAEYAILKLTIKYDFSVWSRAIVGIQRIQQEAVGKMCVVVSSVIP